MMRLTLLGTGNAAQVPVYGCECAVCVSARTDHRKQRLPCCALLQVGSEQLLIDSGLTDLTQRFPSGTLTHILQTHYHADHVQGLLHLRWGKGPKIQVIGPKDEEGFADLFKHSGILDFSHTLQHGDVWVWQGVTITALNMNHSKPTLGYVLDSGRHKVAYLTDTVGLPEATLQYLSAVHLDCLVIDCSHPPQSTPPRNHNDVNEVRRLLADVHCDEVILTHIGHEMDAWVASLSEGLPQSWVLAQDGLRRTFR